MRPGPRRGGRGRIRRSGWGGRGTKEPGARRSRCGTGSSRASTPPRAPRPRTRTCGPRSSPSARSLPRSGAARAVGSSPRRTHPRRSAVGSRSPWRERELSRRDARKPFRRFLLEMEQPQLLSDLLVIQRTCGRLLGGTGDDLEARSGDVPAGPLSVRACVRNARRRPRRGGWWSSWWSYARSRKTNFTALRVSGPALLRCTAPRGAKT